MASINAKAVTFWSAIVIVAPSDKAKVTGVVALGGKPDVPSGFK